MRDSTVSSLLSVGSLMASLSVRKVMNSCNGSISNSPSSRYTKKLSSRSRKTPGCGSKQLHSATKGWKIPAYPKWAFELDICALSALLFGVVRCATYDFKGLDQELDGLFRYRRRDLFTAPRYLQHSVDNLGSETN